MSSYLDVGSGCRKRRRAGERVFKFKSFGENGFPVVFDGSFKDNIKALVRYGHLEINLCNDRAFCWSFQLKVHRHPPLHVCCLLSKNRFKHRRRSTFIANIANMLVKSRNNEGIDEELKKPMPPSECVSLNKNTTFDELKQEVEKSFREAYWRLR